ncbi:hypothetical protein D3C86_2010110 [compost metagenome]
MMVLIAPFMSGSDPTVFNKVSLPTDVASLGATSTNNLPPALRIGAGVINRYKDNPNGFMGSVIIC